MFFSQAIGKMGDFMRLFKAVSLIIGSNSPKNIPFSQQKTYHSLSLRAPSPAHFCAIFAQTRANLSQNRPETAEFSGKMRFFVRFLQKKLAIVRFSRYNFPVTERKRVSDTTQNLKPVNTAMIINTIATDLTATEIADLLTEAGYNYYGLKPKAWEGNTQGRIYFGGRHYLTVIDGTCTSIKPGRCSARSINDEAVEAVAAVIAKAKAAIA